MFVDIKPWIFVIFLKEICVKHLYLTHFCSSPIPYFYPVYLLILLIWRESRDEARCAEKYREIWAEYRKLVPWRILPYVY